jgi:hypothetical protein
MGGGISTPAPDQWPCTAGVPKEFPAKRPVPEAPPAPPEKSSEPQEKARHEVQQLQALLAETEQRKQNDNCKFSLMNDLMVAVDAEVAECRKLLQTTLRPPDASASTMQLSSVDDSRLQLVRDMVSERAASHLQQLETQTALPDKVRESLKKFVQSSWQAVEKDIGALVAAHKSVT